MAYAYDAKKTQAQLRKALDFAKANPDHEDSKMLRKHIEEGKFNHELKAMGLPTPQLQRPSVDIQKASTDVKLMPALTPTQISQGKEAFEAERLKNRGQIAGAAADIGEDFMTMGRNLREGFQERTAETAGNIQRRQQTDKGAFGELGEAVGTGLDFATDTIRTAADAVEEGGMFALKAFTTQEQEEAVENAISNAVGATVEEVTTNERLAPIVDQTKKLVAGYNKWAQENPETAGATKNVGAILGTLAEFMGAKAGATIGKEAVDTAADVIKTQGPKAVEQLERVQPALEQGARNLGEQLDSYSEKRRDARLLDQEGKVTTAVEDILRAGDDQRAIDAGKRFLTSVDTSDVKTYKDLQTKQQDRLQALGNEQNTLLNQYNDRFTSDDLVKTTDVNGTTVEQNFVDSALSQLTKYFEAIDDPVQAAKYRQLSQKLESDGLTISEMNEIAKDHGSKLTGFNANGELASGLNKQSFENTRKGVKSTFREQLEKVADKETRQKSEALDAAMSDLFTVEPLIDKMTEMVARQRQRTFKPTVMEKLKQRGIQALDVASLGSVQRMFPRAIPGSRINESINFAEAEQLLERNLSELRKIEEIENDTDYANALADYLKNLPAGMSIRSSVTPLRVGEEMTETEFDMVAEAIDDIRMARTNPDFNKFLSKYGLSKAEDAELERFLKEATDKFEDPTGEPDFKPPQSFNQGESGRQDLPDDSRGTQIGLSTQDRGAFGKGAEEAFNNFPDLTAKHLNALEGKTTVNKQFILDTANRPELKQPERDLIRAVLDEFPDGKINVQEYADRIKARLLPLETDKARDIFRTEFGSSGGRYENIVLPDELRGSVANYEERIYQSPIKNSAGDVHYGQPRDDVGGYFAHTRIEDLGITNRNRLGAKEELKAYIDMRESQGASVAQIKAELKSAKESETTRRIIEIQSDLFQKGRLEGELDAFKEGDVVTLKDGSQKTISGSRESDDSGFWYRTEGKDGDFNIIFENQIVNGTKQAAQLSPYRNTWWERIVREEVRKAAQDGKTKLQFPTGETAMKIEGLGSQDMWFAGGRNMRSQSDLAVGKEIATDRDGMDAWIITEVLDDGKFKAVPKRFYDNPNLLNRNQSPEEYAEQFDISGKVDTNNPIYKFYEKDVQKYLNKNYKAKRVTDDNGVQWVEFDVPSDAKKLPIEAFGVVGAIGAGMYANQQANE